MNRDEAGYLLLIVIAFFVGIAMSAYLMHNQRMTEAYELGVAYECVGKKGYHFSCEENK